VDEEFDGIRLDVVGDLTMEEVWGMLDEASHLVSVCPVDNGLKNFVDGFKGLEANEKAVQLHCLKSFHDVVAIIA
jgi:hypothetical protein